MEYRYKDLVEAGRKGEQEAMERLIVLLRPLILSTVKRYGWGMEWEEMLQEAALSIMEGVRDFDDQRGIPFLAYMRMRLHFHIYNLSRGQRVECSLQEPIEGGDGLTYLDGLASCDPEPHLAIIMAEEGDMLAAALNDLEVRERQVMKDHYFGGCTLKQIAVRMGTSYKTVLRLKGRALKKLKKNLMRGCPFYD